MLSARTITAFLFVLVAVSCGSQPLTPSELGMLTRRVITSSSIIPTNEFSLWLKADAFVYSDAGVTLATNLQSVVQWNDSSTNAENVTANPSSPVFLENQLNGLPIVRFNTTNAMRRDLYSIPQPTTLVMLVKFNDNNVGTVIGSSQTLCNGNSAPGFLRNQWSGVTTIDGLSRLQRGPNYVCGFAVGPALTDGVWVLITAIFDNTNSLIRINGVSGSTMDVGIDAFSGIRIGYANSVFPFAGDIAEIAKFSARLSDVQILATESYLSNKWGL